MSKWRNLRKNLRKPFYFLSRNYVLINDPDRERMADCRIEDEFLVDHVYNLLMKTKNGSKEDMKSIIQSLLGRVESEK